MTRDGLGADQLSLTTGQLSVNNFKHPFFKAIVYGRSFVVDLFEFGLILGPRLNRDRDPC